MRKKDARILRKENSLFQNFEKHKCVRTETGVLCGFSTITVSIYELLYCIVSDRRLSLNGVGRRVFLRWTDVGLYTIDTLPRRHSILLIYRAAKSEKKL